MNFFLVYLFSNRLIRAKLTDDRSMESMDVELAYSAGAVKRLLKSLIEGSRVVLGESWGVATVCVIMGGWHNILLSANNKDNLDGASILRLSLLHTVHGTMELCSVSPSHPF